MTRSATMIPIAALLLAAGCGGEDPRADSAPPAPSTPASSRPAPSLLATPSPTPAPQLTAVVHKMGQQVTVADGQADGTVFRYRQPIRSVGDLNRGMEWSAGEVRVCLAKTLTEPVAISDGYWTLVYADGGVFEPTNITYRDFPAPEYPKGDGRPTLPGRCVRGWIVFEVPKGKKPQYVEYAPEQTPVPIDWQV